MKRHRSLFVIGVFITLFGFSLFCSGHPDGVESDDYGKVIGQIVDPETGEPVKEQFSINIYESNYDKYPTNLYRWGNKTDDRGKFEMELVPYIYYLQFYPVSHKSKYCMTPYPYSVEENEGLVPGKCGKGRDIDTCPRPLFMMFKQNARLRIQVCCPKSGEDKKNDPQKMSGIVLKHFGYPVLTLQKLSGGEKK